MIGEGPLTACPYCGHDSYYFFVRIMYEYNGEFGKGAGPPNEEVANETRLGTSPKTVCCAKCRRRIPIEKASGSR